MALINPSSLYSEGAVTVDSTPSVNFYAQLMAKKQAKKDALDQYYTKLMDDTQGKENQMRSNDIEEGWQQKLNDWQNFYMNPENRKAITNPSKYGYEKANRFNSMHQDLLSDARKSKEQLDQEKIVNAHRLSGHWFPTDNDMAEVHNISKSIYDPSRKITDTDPQTGLQIQREPSVNNLSVNVPDVTPAEKNQMMKGAMGNIKPTEVAGEPDKANGLITYTSGYKPDDVKSIATNYANNVASNRKFMNSYERLMHDEPTYNRYNQAYKKYFPEEAAMNAEATTGSRVQKYTDPNEWYKRQAVRHANSLENIKVNAYYNSKDPEAINKNVDALIQKHLENSKSLNGEVPMSAATFKDLTGETLTKRTVVKIDDDGNYSYGKKEVDDNGNETGKIVGLKTVPYGEAKDRLTKSLKPALVGNVQTDKTAPEVPTYKKADLLKNGWTNDQINTAVKAGKIKVN